MKSFFNILKLIKFLYFFWLRSVSDFPQDEKVNRHIIMIALKKASLPPEHFHLQVVIHGQS